MSATHNHNMDSGSNYHIDNVKIQEKDLLTTVRGLVEEESKRVVLFVPTITGRNGTTKYAKEFKDYDPVVLHSGTYERVKEELDDDKRKLIITALIS